MDNRLQDKQECHSTARIREVGLTNDGVEKVRGKGEGQILLGPICSILHTKQLKVRGGRDLPRVMWLIRAIASLGSQTSDVVQRDPPRFSKESKATRVLLARTLLTTGTSHVALFPPRSWPLRPHIDYIGSLSLCPRQREGSQAELGYDSFLSIQSSTRQTGWPAGAILQPLTRSQNRAQSGRVSTYTEATEEWPWQDARLCLSDRQQAYLPSVRPVTSPSSPCSGRTKQLSSPSFLIHCPGKALPLFPLSSASLAWKNLFSTVRKTTCLASQLTGCGAWVSCMASFCLSFLIRNMEIRPLTIRCKVW